MGLAVLPARLARDMGMLERALAGTQSLLGIPELAVHAKWATKIIEQHPELNAQNARGILEQEIGKVFLEVLCDAGVFKRTEDGKSAFMRFVETLND